MNMRQEIGMAGPLILGGFLILFPAGSFATTKLQQAKRHSVVKSLTRAELKQAQTRLAEMGYGSGRNALVAFQKYEGRKVTGQLSRDELDAIMSASAPQPRDSGYKHVEVDLDRQVL